MSPEKGETRVSVRFERTDDGELILSIDGKEAARARHNAYNNFTKLRAIMTTPRGRLGFDNPKLTGYFAKEQESHAPTPWIIPEPKEMVKNGSDSYQLQDALITVF